MRDGADALIMTKVKPLVHVIPDTKEADLPSCTQHVIRFAMPAETRAVYDEMKKHMVVGDVEAANEAVKSGKLRQIASGFMYTEDKEIVYLDAERVTSAVKWWDALDGGRGLVFYEYIEQRLSDFR